MAAERKSAHESPVYYKLSNLYESAFGPFFGPRARKMIRSLNIPAGAKVLEVGVGTGLSLPAYPAHAQVTGIDLSEHMLVQARHKVDAKGWQHITLRQMDALNLEFPDDEFDYVMAFHVVTVVPDPERFMSEVLRVCKPGGTVLIINHLRSARRWLARGVDALAPVTRWLGWRTDLSADDLARTPQLKIHRRFKTSPWSLFTVIIASKLTAAPAGPGSDRRDACPT
jgi:phosphatidylethanolamine/phosphatidyl-N-methylethanolamine N-methyltransferase